MSTYLLQEDEKELRVATPSWLMLLFPIVLSFVFIGIPLLLYRVLRRSTTKYIITNRRVIWLYGILGKSSKEAPLDKINNVSHQQSLFGRIFNYGDVQLQTASEMGATVFAFIPYPAPFKSEIVNQMELFKKAELGAQALALAEGMAAAQGESAKSARSRPVPSAQSR